MAYVEFRLGGGLNQKSEVDMIADNELQEAIGCRFDDLGSVASERGRDLLRTFADGEVQGMHTSYKLGARQRIVKTGGALYQNGDSIGSMSGSDYMTGVTYHGLDYLVDGTNALVWNNSSFRTQIGLNPPTTPLTLTAKSTGGALISGVYEVVYTWVIKRSDGSTACESNFSPVDEDGSSGTGTVTISSGTTNSIALSGFESAPTGATHIRLYRTLPDKKNYFFDQEIDIISTSATITNLVPDTKGDQGTDDATLATADIAEEPRPASSAPNKPYMPFRKRSTIQQHFPTENNSQSSTKPQVIQTNIGALADWTDHDAAPIGLKHLVMANRQLFGFVGNKVYFSRVGEPEHWPVFNALTVGRDTGETLQTIMVLGGAVIAYTDSNIYRMDLINLSYEDIRVTDMRSPVGVCSEWSVVDINVGGRQAHLFMAKNGLYIFDGQAVTEVGFRVEKLFNGDSSADGLSKDNANLVKSVSYRDRAWFTYPSTGTNDRTLMVDFQEPDNPKFSVTRYGYTALYREQETGTILGGDASGNFYTVDVGDANGGQALQWAVRTKEFPLGSSNAMVSLESVVIDADIGGVSTFTNIVTDNGLNAATILTGAAGRQRHVVEVPNWMKGRRVSVRLQSAATVPRKAYGVGFNYREEGQPTP